MKTLRANITTEWIKARAWWITKTIKARILREACAIGIAIRPQGSPSDWIIM